MNATLNSTSNSTLISKPKSSLTNRQRSILEYVRSCIKDHGRSPTLREMCDKFQISSTNGIRDHLKALINKGYLIKDSMVSRGLRLVEEVSAEVMTIPLVGSAPAGNPLTAIENYEGEVALDKSFLPSGESFTLRVKGESMKGAGIYDGDLVIVRKQSSAETGEIIVAVVDGEATIKRIHYNKSEGAGGPDNSYLIILMPDNPEFQPIPVETESQEFYIAGKIVGLMRKMG